AEIENTDSDWDREKLQERLAKLAGGVSVIKVGAHTEVELKEKKMRIEDAVSATRAAIEEGIVAVAAAPSSRPPPCSRATSGSRATRPSACAPSPPRSSSRCAGSPRTRATRATSSSRRSRRRRPAPV